MGTTANKLAYLNDTKTAIKTAIVGSGIDVPDGTPFRAFADKVDSIVGQFSDELDDIMGGGLTPSEPGKTITPGTTEQTAISAGVLAGGDIKVAGDANLKPANIAQGIKIFEVTGTYKGTQSVTGTINFSKATYDTILYVNNSQAQKNTLNGATSVNLTVSSNTMLCICYIYGGNSVQQSAYSYQGLSRATYYEKYDTDSSIRYRVDSFYITNNFTLNCSSTRAQ